MHIAAQPETVFPYFTDPARYVQWMGTEATLEAVPGGRYRVACATAWRRPASSSRSSHRAGWCSPGGGPSDHAVGPGTTRVVVTFEAEDGGTRVVLRHHDLPDETQGAQHRMGWDLYLGRLGLVVLGQDPGRDPNA